MIDLEILKECGTTNEALREFFTSAMPSAQKQARMRKTKEGIEELEAMQEQVNKRQEFERLIAGWLQEHVIYALANYKLYAAVDMAWDSVPIQKHMIPLLQYAQGRIDMKVAEKELANLPNHETYVRKNDAGQVIGIDLPKFTEMNINLVRSVITRRLAAQEVKYNGLFPFYKFEPRSTTQVGKLRGDLTSQRMDVMADAYGHRHQQTQFTREMFLYTTTVAFPRASWERDVQWVKKPVAPELSDKDGKVDGKIPKEAKVVREGISWVSPHPTRLFYDNAYPLSSLNTDTGCEYVGFWDVLRFGDVKSNPDYFNREKITFSTTAQWFYQYAAYFNHYYYTIVPPNMPQADDTARNDRKNNVGLYQGGMESTGVFFTHLWRKIVPKDWGIGTYPYPIWVHLQVAGDTTVVYADIMPSSPAAVYSLNAHEARLENISMAMELMQYQDQISNLYSQLLQTIKADLCSIAILNTDIFPDTEEGRKVRDEFKKVIQGKNYYADMQILETSFEKLSAILGHDITADMVFKVVRSTPNTAITAIFNAIASVVQLAEKMMVLSQHEQGQAASHEISATESTEISKSTDTVYSFISNAIDEGRAAQKRICFESMIACGEDNVALPVMSRYPDSIIKKAGFEVSDKAEDRDEGDPVGFKIVMGHKDNLIHDYIFTSRDGDQRPSSAQGATVLVQLIQGIGSLQPNVQNAVLSAMGKQKVLEIFNTIFRLADVGVDLKLELKPGDTDALLVEDDQQVMGMIQQLAQSVKQDSTDIQMFKQLLMQMGILRGGQPGMPGAAPAGAPGAPAPQMTQ